VNFALLNHSSPRPLLREFVLQRKLVDAFGARLKSNSAPKLYDQTLDARARIPWGGLPRH